MSRRFLLLMLLVVGSGCSKPAEAVDPGTPADTSEHVLAVREPGPGTTLQGSFRLDLSAAVHAHSNLGFGFPLAPAGVTVTGAFTETLLDRPAMGRPPTRSRIRINRWDQAAHGPIPVAAPPTKSVGRAILVEPARGVVRAEDGRPLDWHVRSFLEHDYARLCEAFSLAAVLPGKPVRAGDAWDVPAGKVAGALGFTDLVPVNETRSRATAHLAAVSERDGRKYGRIRVRASLVPVSRGAVRFADGATIEVTGSVDACIDGSTHDIRADIRVNADFEVVDPDLGFARVMLRAGLIVSRAESRLP